MTIIDTQLCELKMYCIVHSWKRVTPTGHAVSAHAKDVQSIAVTSESHPKQYFIALLPFTVTLSHWFQSH